MLDCTVPLAGPGAGRRPLPHFSVLTLGAPSCLAVMKGRGIEAPGPDTEIGVEEWRKGYNCAWHYREIRGND